MTVTSGSTADCVDASLVVRVLDAPAYPEVEAVWIRLIGSGSALIAPSVLHYEIANELHQQQRAGRISEQLALDGLSRVVNLPIELHGDAQLHMRALELAVEHRLPATYDAHYLALAQRFGVPFWTCDARLAAAVAGRLPWVHLVA